MIKLTKNTTTYFRRRYAIIHYFLSWCVRTCCQKRGFVWLVPKRRNCELETIAETPVKWAHSKYLPGQTCGVPFGITTLYIDVVLFYLKSQWQLYTLADILSLETHIVTNKAAAFWGFHGVKMSIIVIWLCRCVVLKVATDISLCRAALIFNAEVNRRSHNPPRP